MFGCKCVSVTAIIYNSSVKFLRKSNLFRVLRIFILHIEMELSLALECFFNSGPGLTSTLPMIRIIRKNELENHIDESIWVEIQGKGTKFSLCNT
jgi:hypothetical protein